MLGLSATVANANFIAILFITSVSLALSYCDDLVFVLCLIIHMLCIVGKMRQSNLLQKTVCTFKGAIVVILKQDVIIPEKRPF